MKTIFVINPKAGNGRNINNLIDRIKQFEDRAEYYITKFPGDARNFVESFCRQNGPARFIACGGDGTLNEVLNGAMPFENAEIGVVPIGSGNDFVRNFLYGDKFLDIDLLMSGTSVKCDAIKYATLVNGAEVNGYCANMFNIGFDCNVADVTNNLKKNTFLSGPMAYVIAIFISLIRKKCSLMKIELDGQNAYDGKLLLTSLANGGYCGGGINSNPLAVVNDGLISINIIKNVSRMRFLTLLPYYMKGTFHKISGIEKYIFTDKCRKITVIPNTHTMRICVDGEIIDAGKTRFEIVHDAFRFVIPFKTDFANDVAYAHEKIGEC